MSETQSTQDVPGLVRPQPLTASVFAVAFMGTAAWMFCEPSGHLLRMNWLTTSLVVIGLLLSLFWIIPKWAPSINRYLWTESRNVSITYSASVALVSYFLAILVNLVLMFTAQLLYPGMTQHWLALWSIGLVSGIVPVLIVIFLGLVQAGAIKRLQWLDAARLVMTETKERLNDRGRIFVLLVAAIDIAMIQGAVVLTGGLSVSPFSVLLVLTGSVAAIASERPVYAIFTVMLACQAAIATELVGSYAPPDMAFYPTAHIVIFALSMVVVLLIDLGRKSRPVEPGTAARKQTPHQDRQR